MIATIITSLWLLFILFVVGTLLCKACSKSSQSFCFQGLENKDIPYITIIIQGQELNMLVDSCAGVSIISASILDNLSYKDCDRKVCMSALTGESISSKMVTISVPINDREVEEDFLVHSNDDIGNFKKLYGIQIHGILGNEFFEKTGCKIDYRNHMVTFY